VNAFVNLDIQGRDEAGDFADPRPFGRLENSDHRLLESGATDPTPALSGRVGAGFRLP